MISSETGSPGLRARAVGQALVHLGVPIGQSTHTLHACIFNAHGWTLAITGQPLVSDRAEAWDVGPMFPALWNNQVLDGHSLYDGMDATILDPMPEDIQRILQGVALKYGSLSSLELVHMHHQPGSSWYKSYFGRGRHAGIHDRETQAFFTALALAGRQK